MNSRSVRALVRRDLLTVTRSRAVVIPLVGVPVGVLVAIPLLLALVRGLDPTQTFVLLALRELMVPVYLVVPLLVATVIAADAFAGERERGTLEAVLYTPTTDAELLLAKVLVAWLPAVAVAGVGFVLYAGIADLVAWPILGRPVLPDPTWGVLVVFVAPAVAGLGLGVTVLVSSRVRTFQAAWQRAGLAVLPLVALMVAEAEGVVHLGLGMVLALGAGCWVGCGVLLYFGTRTFRRGEILARR